MGFQAGDKVGKGVVTPGLAARRLPVECAYGPFTVTVDGLPGVFLDGEDRVRYHAVTGQELDPVIPGCSARLIAWAGD